MNLLHLRYFVELAGTQHYTRAAEKLCITQPSLSHAMAQLEAELGVPLFEKMGRGVVLTPFGQQFLSCARQTLLTLDEGVEELRRVGRGEGLSFARGEKFPRVRARWRRAVKMHNLGNRKLKP